MPPRFFTPCKKWPSAVREALSHITGLPGSGAVDHPAFRCGPPSRGRFPLRLTVSGRTALLCELGDDHPFLDELREWMERCLEFDVLGDGCPAAAHLSLPEGTLTLLMVHAGWEMGEDGRAVPVSLLAAVRSGEPHPAACCFCNPAETVGALYAELMDAFRRYRLSFDDPLEWYDIGRFSGRDGRDTATRMEDRLRSRKVERRTGLYKKVGG